ncbi:MAG: AAA family ATPase [Chitinophagales bacterium]
MISKIQIKNFKSVVDLTLELGRLNVFIGENGCGKTNILEAITCGSIAAENGNLNNALMSLKGIRVTEAHLIKTAFDISAKKDEVIEVYLFNEKGEYHIFRTNIDKRKQLSNSYGVGSLTEETLQYIQQYKEEQKNFMEIVSFLGVIGLI